MSQRIATSVFGSVLSIAILGCETGSPTASKPEAAATTAPSPPVSEEATVKETLKLALDSWVLGDDQKKFREAHPEIAYFDVDWAVGDILMRYELGPSRKTKEGMHEVSVVLVFQSRVGTEIKKSRRLTAQKNTQIAGGWIVTTH